VIDATQHEQRVLASLLINKTQYRSALVEKYGEKLIQEAINEGIIICTAVGFTSITDKGRQRFNSLGERLEKSFVAKAQTVKPVRVVKPPKPKAERVKPVKVVSPPKPKRPRSKLDPKLCEKNYTRTFDLAKVNRMILLLEGREYDVQMQEITALAQEWGMKLRLVRDKAYRLGLLGVYKVTPWNDPLEVRFILKLNKIGMSEAKIVQELAKKGWTRSRSMIYRKLQSLGLVRPRAPEWTKEEEGFLLENYSKMTFTEISHHIKRPPDAINMKAIRLGLQRPKKVRNGKS
jgi:hypothetical protein